ncbi:MAG TPA: GAF domain-containing sensor histidine kinase [Anaerolineae bacterium]|nr:GAF domain-containing sensor histidine kinase [Anaerolineae bacterium]
MDDAARTKDQLIEELTRLRRRVAELETGETERAQAAEELKQQNATLAALNAMAVIVGQSLNLEQLVNAALAKIIEITGALAGTVQLDDNTGIQNHKTDSMVVRWGYTSDKAIENNRWTGLEIPIIAQEQTLGRLVVFKPTVQGWQDQDEQLLTAIGYELGVGIAKARLFEAMERQSNQLRVLGQRVVEAEEAERRRLARELHDQVGQSLTAIGINLDILSKLLPEDIPQQIISRLDDMRTLVTQTNKRVREVMVNLRPEMLDDYGILAALRWSAERFTNRTGIPVQVNGKEAESRLSIQVENVLYRVAQEALTNVAKHAQATQVTINLTFDAHHVQMIVADNGVGINPTEQTLSNDVRRWGTAIMAERVEGVNGHFSLQSAPSQGVKIIVEVPR